MKSSDIFFPSSGLLFTAQSVNIFKNFFSFFIFIFRKLSQGLKCHGSGNFTERKIHLWRKGKFIKYIHTFIVQKSSLSSSSSFTDEFHQNLVLFIRCGTSGRSFSASGTVCRIDFWLRDGGVGKNNFVVSKLAYPIKILIETHRFTLNIWLKVGRRWKSIDLARMRNWHGVTGSAENHIRWIDLLRNGGRRWSATC